ncbi:tRNA uridine-5-carboxymethylaminomethyl(34) synthesis GTPase MnmE [Dyadobacter fanqingshengii]|uniref:tRNA modification GTPase MnmE n=1 Tax=Dyadobacter fanqingshengii TaxID=2906443 RepID=A0A9X1PET7_9BACT|nr:tRNA uridine-5-carboxymethylaminomethyl(34) synthesis GTPase MnmE [Dyadobacter fanqingshengii]MCF0041952.1 tRNA uridine-5-carboxymethylaminomethyl(34) synthesis GTPase MnmE [Dyadobacter fanqingshengii]USJ36342.1 tRNA uridine-5-carboxymethylaminomethyl(34) synthesis GTPase MnmE [Dyadobacter fanqingshengii]
MNAMPIHQQEVICALATPSGVGAIAIIRVSGLGSISMVKSIFKGKNLEEAESHTVHFGTIQAAGEIIDEVLVTVFKTPKSFTKEDSIEISCHGSDYIIRQILKLLITKGARIAKPGEFTQRAFLNGQFDLVQAEAVADLIAADSQASHKTALNQLRGGFSKKLASLRTELIHFASLIELELDFGEEDVEFAQRDDLRRLIEALLSTIAPLIDSFDFGNALKEGVPVAIIGSPNVGKSTLLNALLNEEKAIVTSIAGTTRDVIEDTIVLEGLKFRFIDTAGIRETTDLVESIGIERSKNAMEKADIVIFLFDSLETLRENQQLGALLPDGKQVLYVLNKIDIGGIATESLDALQNNIISISAKSQTGLSGLTNKLVSMVYGQSASDTVVTNLRHYEHLVKTHDALNDVLNGLETGVTGDFLAQDIRLSLHHLGEITGTIVTDDLLDNIFSKFCIGK